MRRLTEDEHGVAQLEPVTVAQLGLADPAAVDRGAVGAAEVLVEPVLAVAAHHAVTPGNAGVGESDVRVGGAADQHGGAWSAGKRELPLVPRGLRAAESRGAAAGEHEAGARGVGAGPDPYLVLATWRGRRRLRIRRGEGGA